MLIGLVRFAFVFTDFPLKTTASHKFRFDYILTYIRTIIINANN